MFDALHHILRKKSDVAAARGAHPRHRIVTDRRGQSTKFVAGLPINTYDSRWIESNALRKYDLRPITEPYDFSHDVDIIESVSYILELICVLIGHIHSIALAQMA
jgi:hypothetical protein